MRTSVRDGAMFLLFLMQKQASPGEKRILEASQEVACYFGKIATTFTESVRLEVVRSVSELQT